MYKKKPAQKIISISHNEDKSLIFLIAGFLLFGIIVIFNSTTVQSLKIYGDASRFFLYHIAWTVVGLVGFFITYKFDILRFLKLNKFFYIVTAVFLFILMIASFLPCENAIIFARCENAANRWFYFNPPPFPQIPIIGELGFQPSELAKLTLTIFLAVQLSRSFKKKYQPFWYYLLGAGFFSALIILQPNMSTSVTVFIIGTLMYITSGATLKPLFLLFPIMLFMAFLFIMTTPYRRERLMTFFKSNQTTLNQEEDYQIKQAKIALGSGGFFGKGLGQSRQKYGYTPEIASDATFAIVGEEFGFVGVSVLLFCYGLLIFKGLTIAKRAVSSEESLIAVGVTSWIGLQLLIHVTSNTGMIPYTGVTLPLISYGGSSLLFTLMGLGLLANIDRTSTE